MDAIENRRGFSSGMRTLRTMLHGSEINKHSKKYYDEKLSNLRGMYCPSFKAPHDVGETSFVPASSEHPHANISAGWFCPENPK